MTDKLELGGLSVDVAVRFKKLKGDSGVWESIIWVVPTLPFCFHLKREAVVEIRESGSDRLISSSVLTGRYSSKLSVILFLGAISFGQLDGYQENVTNYEDTFEKDERGKIKVDEKGAVTIIRSAKVINAFNRALAHCIAMQIRKCMLDRLTMPDIDIDFCFERRQEVIDYVVRKYGKDRVVQIVTFGTLAARGVIRDVGRALDLPYAQVDSIAKMIPQELNVTIDHALKVNSELKKLYDTDQDIKYLIDMSKRLEGLPRHTSMHAAGVVISKAPVDEYVPLSRSSDESVTTQYTMTTLEELGLLKMDFLGLRTLTVIQDTINLVKKNKGINVYF